MTDKVSCVYVLQHPARSHLLHRTHILGCPLKPRENGFRTTKECTISVTLDIHNLASQFNAVLKENGLLLNRASNVLVGIL